MRRAPGLLIASMVLAVAGASVATADTVIGTRSASTFTSNDSLHWGLLGVNNFFVANGSTLSTENGILTTINFGHTGPTGFVAGTTFVQCPVFSCSWTGNFAPGDILLTDLNIYAGGNSGSIILSFATGISGIGFQLEPNTAPAGSALTFSTEIAVYDGGTLLDTLYFPFGTEASHLENNSAGFYGVTDLSGADITSIQVLAYNCGAVGTDLCGGFAIGTGLVEDASAVHTPEPASLALLGSGLGILGFLRRKLAARK